MILDRFKLDGKNALVTGAGRGIGRALAFALAEAGANVAVADILKDNAEQTAKEIAEATGRRTIAAACDIADADSVDAMVRKVVDAFGKLDIAANNAGISIPIKGILEVSAEEWKHQMDVNLNGTWNCIRAESKVMIPNGYGKIINTGSICGHVIWPDPQLPYSVSKAAVIHMTRAAAAPPRSPSAAIFPPRTPTSSRCASAPLPSSTKPVVGQPFVKIQPMSSVHPEATDMCMSAGVLP